MILHRFCTNILLFSSSIVFGMELDFPARESNANSIDMIMPRTPEKKASIYSYNENSPFKKNTVLFSDDNAIQNEIIKRINETPAGGYIHIQSPFISLWRLESPLNNAITRGVYVEVDGTHRSQLFNTLSKDVKKRIVPGLHSKRVIIASQMPSAFNGEQETHIFMGSDNLSNTSSGNQEIMEYSRNDKGWFATHYEDLQKKRSLTSDAKTILKITPAKNTLISTQEYEVNESKVARIKTIEDVLKKDKNIPFQLDIVSMTFNDADIAQAVVDVCNAAGALNQGMQQVRIIVDKSAAKSLANKKLLQQMRDAGAQVYIYNHDSTIHATRNYLSLQHQKTMIRFIQGYTPEYLTIISTGNLTDKSQQEQNIESYDISKDAKDKFDLIKKHNDALILACKPLKSSSEGKPSAAKKIKM